MQIWIHEDSRKPEFFYSLKETLTIIYRLIKNFMGYNLILNSRGKDTVLKYYFVSHFSKNMKNPLFGAMFECYVLFCGTLAPLPLALSASSRHFYRIGSIQIPGEELKGRGQETPLSNNG
jgi:hypothetical protein